MKISSLQDKIHCVDDEANRNLLSSDNAVRTLSNEVRFLKSSLEQTTEREHRVSHSHHHPHLQSRTRTLSSLVTRFPCIDRENARPGRQGTVHTRLRNHRSFGAPSHRGPARHGHSDRSGRHIEHGGHHWRRSVDSAATAAPSPPPSPWRSFGARPTSQSQSGHVSHGRQSSSTIDVSLARRHRSSNVLTAELRLESFVFFFFLSHWCAYLICEGKHSTLIYICPSSNGRVDHVVRPSPSHPTMYPLSFLSRLQNSVEHLRK